VVNDHLSPAESIRNAMAEFPIADKVNPNATITTDQPFFPDGHRGVFDLSRQLVVGNRGMGKSFWAHALMNEELRGRFADTYKLPVFENTKVVIGFNASTKIIPVALTPEAINRCLKNGATYDEIWCAVLVNAVRSQMRAGPETPPLTTEVVEEIQKSPDIYNLELSKADDEFITEKKTLLIIFDALDRLSSSWEVIRPLTQALLKRALEIHSFKSIKVKIFMRIDQFADSELFRFPDSSKITNDSVNLNWQPRELYGLLLHELQRSDTARQGLFAIAEQKDAIAALPRQGKFRGSDDQQTTLINAISGEFMGANKKRGRVYTWVPLHLSDAAQNCSPRTFLTAWKSAAEHLPAPSGRAVDHLGLIDGVRQASKARLAELNEDYHWIAEALGPLKRQFVPMSKDELFALWESAGVVPRILTNSEEKQLLAPIALSTENSPDALLKTLTDIAVMEVRTNGKINVPDIFRVEAEILRKGGVAVPRRH